MAKIKPDLGRLNHDFSSAFAWRRVAGGNDDLSSGFGDGSTDAAANAKPTDAAAAADAAANTSPALP